MRFSLFLPTIHEGRFIPMGALGPAHVVELSQAAEELGYDGLWIGEFMESQDDIKRQYADPPAYYAPLALLGVLAARTRGLRLTTGVLVLPYHDPLILAREFATLDVLSGGRMVLGVGLGGAFDNFRRTRKLTRRVHRAQLMEEAIRAIRSVWEERRATFVGDYFELHDLESFPKPVQRPPAHRDRGRDPSCRGAGRPPRRWMDRHVLPANGDAKARRAAAHCRARSRA